MEEKYKDLIKRLIKTSEAGKIEWKKSSKKGQYRLELKSATFVIDKMSSDLIPAPMANFSLNMYNSQGIEIPIATESNSFTDTLSSRTLLVDLYQAAEKSCLQESVTIKNVIEELDRLDLPF